MSDSALDRFFGRLPGQPADNAAEIDAVEEYGCFSLLRGVRDRAIMLELRKLTGQSKAFGYAWLESAEFDPNDGIALYFPGTIVRIRGKNLNQPVGERGRRFSLFTGIQWHRVQWVEEAPQYSSSDSTDQAFIQDIHW